jgi:hypothetical protein
MFNTVEVGGRLGMAWHGMHGTARVGWGCPCVPLCWIAGVALRRAPVALMEVEMTALANRGHGQDEGCGLSASADEVRVAEVPSVDDQQGAPSAAQAASVDGARQQRRSVAASQRTACAGSRRQLSMRSCARGPAWGCGDALCRVSTRPHGGGGGGGAGAVRTRAVHHAVARPLGRCSGGVETQTRRRARC